MNCNNTCSCTWLTLCSHTCTMYFTLASCGSVSPYLEPSAQFGPRRKKPCHYWTGTRLTSGARTDRARPSLATCQSTGHRVRVLFPSLNRIRRGRAGRRVTLAGEGGCPGTSGLPAWQGLSVMSDRPAQWTGVCT